MLSFFRKNKLYSPVDGISEALTDVNDEVFSSLMIGDGIAIKPTSDTIVAPCDCLVSLIMKGSNHALGLVMNNGIELLIHVGIDTVNLEGEGFKVLINEGKEVKCGTPLLKFDKKIIEARGYSTITMMIVTDAKGNKISKKYENIEVLGGKTSLIEFK